MPMKKPNPKHVGDLKKAKYNPREIEPAALAGLGESMKRFGDLSGIVYNLRTGALVAGHQRIESLKSEHGEDALKIQGAGIKVPGGEVFAIRYVDWDLKTEKAANIAANNQEIQGVFTDDIKGILDELKAEDEAAFESLRMGALADSLVLPGADFLDDTNPPGEFSEFSEDIETTHECPKCGYKWS